MTARFRWGVIAAAGSTLLVGAAAIVAVSPTLGASEWVASFQAPMGLALFGLTPALVFLSWPPRASRTRAWGFSLIARTTFMAALILALARPVRVARSRDVFAVCLVDVSDSVSEAALADYGARLRRAAARLRHGDRLRVVPFARHAVPLPEGGTPLDADLRHTLRDAAAGDMPTGATNIAGALRLARGLFEDGYLKRVAVLSDFNETEGDVEREASRAAADGVRVFALPYAYAPVGEVAVAGVTTKGAVRAGGLIELRVKVFATTETAATITLEGEGLRPSDDQKRLTLHPGENEVVFQRVVPHGREATFTARLKELGADRFAENNAWTISLPVSGPPVVLLVDGSGVSGTYLEGALRSAQFDVERVSPSRLARTARPFEPYDFVILSDVAPGEITAAAAQALSTFVRGGGGVLFIGGVRGLAVAPGEGGALADLLPVRPSSELREVEPSVALSLVIDRSGSMTGPPLEMAKSAALAAAAALAPDDLVEVIAFDSTPTRVVRLMAARNGAEIAADIARIAAGGGTDILPALDAAYQSLASARALRKHVILLTDGQARTGKIRELVSALAAEAITVSTIGLGDEIDEALLRMIADVSGGRFYKVNEPRSLPQLFVRETRVIGPKRGGGESFVPAVVADASFLRGISFESAPPLHGAVPAEMKPLPAQAILAAGGKRPLLARMRVGLGSSLVFTSDATSGWGGDWVRWPSFARLFGQLVHDHMRPQKRGDAPMEVAFDKQRSAVTATVDAVGENDEFRDELRGHVDIAAPGDAGGLTLPLKHTAPGRYEATFLAPSVGGYRIHAQLYAGDDAGAPVLESEGHAENPYPTEYASIAPDRARMEQVVRSTGGRILGGLEEVFDAEGESVPAREPLWMQFVGLELLGLLAEIALRRRAAFAVTAPPRR